MPEHLRALVVIVVLSSLGFWLMRPAIVHLVGSATFAQWRNLWLGLTLVAFLSHSFWVYAAVMALALTLKRPAVSQTTALWLLLMFLVPAAGINIPGLGIINYFFTLNHLRLLSLVLLLPAAFVLLQQRDTLRLGSTWPDRLLLAYLLLAAVLQLREANITSTLRGCFYLFTDVFLPYYVASRSLRSLTDFRYALSGLLVSTVLLAGLGIFETLRHWNLYAAVDNVLGTHWGFSGYLGRAGIQRASVSTGQPLAFGLTMAVALGIFMYCRKAAGGCREWLGWLVIVGGLLASLSRGPWLGAVFTLAVFVVLGPRPVKNLLLLGLAGILSMAALSLFPAGQKLIDMLPFIGTVDEFNVTYRQQLLQNAWAVVERNYWLGSVDYMQTPELQAMVQGEGIIDIVNTYVGVALDYGMVGLSLFTSFFAITLMGLWQVLRRQQDPESALLGRALLAAMAGVVLIIFTVSSISIIPWLYWTLAGICVAYSSVSQRTTSMSREA